MYDVKKIMQERTLLSPLPTPDPAKFPRDEEVPEGCHVLENLADDWGYDVDIHTDIVYAKRCGTKEEKNRRAGTETDHSGAEAERERRYCKMARCGICAGIRIS